MTGPWTGDGQYRLAPAIATLLRQLKERYPGQQWLTSPQTGTKGDLKHQAESTDSDHNPWLARTVRALDIAANVSGVPGIVTVTDAPDCEALFAMVNRMYAARDPRVWPNGYAIFNRRITDPNNPGGYWPQRGDPHLYHLHISVSQNPSGFNSTAPWPLPSSSESASAAGRPIQLLTEEEDEMILVRKKSSPNLVGLLTNKGIAILQDADTVHSLRDAGVPVAKAPIGDRDFDSLVRWGRL